MFNGLPTLSNVYAYARFSTKNQSSSDSERRQYESAKIWGEEPGCKITYFVDPGISARHGKKSNRRTVRCLCRAVCQILEPLFPAPLGRGVPEDRPPAERTVCPSKHHRRDVAHPLWQPVTELSPQWRHGTPLPRAVHGGVPQGLGRTLLHWQPDDHRRAD